MSLPWFSLPESHKPSVVNGIEVPYDAEVATLRSALENSSRESWPACIALGHNPSREALEALITVTASPDWCLRAAAVEAIPLHPEAVQAIGTLTALLDDPSPYVVRAACRALGALGAAESHDRILALCKSKNEATRGEAVRTIGRLWQESDFLEVFQVDRKDASAEIRKAAAWALFSRVTERTWKVLFEAWQADSRHHCRVWACQLAQRYGSRSCLAVLERLAGDKDGHVRKAAQRALAALS